MSISSAVSIPYRSVVPKLEVDNSEKALIIIKSVISREH